MAALVGAALGLAGATMQGLLRNPLADPGVLGVQALEYAFLSIVLAVLALLLGLGGAWYVVTQLFAFAWLPDYAVVLATLLGGAALTMAIGLLGAWPILGARPASALRQL